MDIQKFNKKLEHDILKARGLENKKKLSEAVEAWIGISEYVLRASREKGLNFAYKSMLIEKTEKIIDHVKDLKLKIAGYDRKEIELAEDYLLGKNKTEVENEQKLETKAQVKDEVPANSEESDIITKPVDIIEHTEYKNMPEGFKEIKASEKFKIITPHDEDHVKNLIKQESISESPNIESNLNEEMASDQESERFNFKSSKKKEGMRFCFACGNKVSLKAKTCPSCNANLEDE